MRWAGDSDTGRALRTTPTCDFDPGFSRLLEVSLELLETNTWRNLLGKLERKAEPSGSEIETKF